MKKLTILVLATILCCMTACEKNESNSFSPKDAVTFLDQILDLTTNEAIDKIEKSGLSLCGEEDGGYYFFDKSQKQIIFIGCKNGKVVETRFAEDGVTKEKANSVMRSWINQIGRCYEGEHKFEFEEVGNQSITSISYSKIEEIMASATDKFWVVYIGGISVHIAAGSNSEQAEAAQTYDYYEITMSRNN